MAKKKKSKNNDPPRTPNSEDRKSRGRESQLNPVGSPKNAVPSSPTLTLGPYEVILDTSTFVNDSRSSGMQLQSKVYLNAHDMKMNRIQTGALVSVRKIVPNIGNESGNSAPAPSTKVVLVGIAWPSSKVSKRQMVLHSIWRTSRVMSPNNSSAKFHIKPVNQERVLFFTAKRIELSFVYLEQRITLFPSKSKEKLAYVLQYLQTVLAGAIIYTNSIVVVPVFGTKYEFQVTQVHSDQSDLAAECSGTKLFRLDSNTTFRIGKEEDKSFSEVGSDTNIAASSSSSTNPAPEYEAIGGLKQQIETIAKLIEVPLKSPEVFRQYNLKPPKGLLMFGPPGTGKTMIARAIANSTQSKVFIINGPEIISKYVGESETKLKTLFERAAEESPSLIFIDEIDAICPKRDSRSGEMESRIVATLLTLMDGLNTSSNVFVLAATNRPNALDPAVRRPGRFDREVEIPIPNEDDRFDILRATLEGIPHDLSPESIEKLASKTHGYVGADLNAICKTAALHALQRSSSIPRTTSERVYITMEDMIKGLGEIRPSALREISVDIPHVKWSDIGGQQELKQQLKEAVEWPLKHPEAFIRMGIRPPKGVLLYGPPGCSKTLTAKALATESGMNFIAVKGPELFSKWVGDSEKAVQSIFKKARAAAPTVVFFDEIDALAVQRGGAGGGSQVADRVLSQLLNELDGIQPMKRVLVVAATNRPDLIDDALMRPGRIDRILFVGPPDSTAREEILKIHTRKMPLGSDVVMSQLGDICEGYSGAEIASICREAALSAIEESTDAEYVAVRHFEKAITRVTPQITTEMLQFFKNFEDRGRL